MEAAERDALQGVEALGYIDIHDRDTWRSGVISVMRIASQLPGRGRGHWCGYCLCTCTLIKKSDDDDDDDDVAVAYSSLFKNPQLSSECLYLPEK